MNKAGTGPDEWGVPPSAELPAGTPAPSSVVPWRIAATDDSYRARGIRHTVTRDLHFMRALPSDHEVSIYANDLARRIDPDLQVYVCRLPSEPSVMISPDGRVVMSLSFLCQAEYEEDILGVLAHERRHLDQVRDAGAKNSAVLGRVRANEHDADMRGVVFYLEERGINAYGFLRMLEKFAASSGMFHSPTHGNSRDRILSVYLLSRFKDLTHLSKAGLTPIPRNMRNAIRDALSYDTSRPQFVNSAKKTRPTVSPGIGTIDMRKQVADWFWFKSDRKIEDTAYLVAIMNTLDDSVAIQETASSEVGVPLLAAGVFGFPVRSLRESLDSCLGDALDEWMENADETSFRIEFRAGLDTAVEYCRNTDEFFTAEPKDLLGGFAGWVIGRLTDRWIKNKRSPETDMECELEIRRAMSAHEAIGALLGDAYAVRGLHETKSEDTADSMRTALRATFRSNRFNRHLHPALARVLEEMDSHDTILSFRQDPLMAPDVKDQETKDAYDRMYNQESLRKPAPKTLLEAVAEKDRHTLPQRLRDSLRILRDGMPMLDTATLDALREELVRMRQNHFIGWRTAGYADDQANPARVDTALRSLEQYDDEDFRKTDEELDEGSEEEDDELGGDDSEQSANGESEEDPIPEWERSDQRKLRPSEKRQLALNRAYAAVVHGILDAVSADFFTKAESRAAYMRFLREAPLHEGGGYGSYHRNFLLQQSDTLANLAIICRESPIEERLEYMRDLRHTPAYAEFENNTIDGVIEMLRASGSLGESADLLRKLADSGYDGLPMRVLGFYQFETDYNNPDDAPSDDDDEDPDDEWLPVRSKLMTIFENLPRVTADATAEDLRACVHALRIYENLLRSRESSVTVFRVRAMQQDARRALFQLLSFEQAHDLIAHSDDAILSAPESLYSLVEEKARTVDDIARAKELTVQYSQGETDKEFFSNVWRIALGESYVSSEIVRITGLSRKVLLKLLLKTGTDDAYLRSRLLAYAEYRRSEDKSPDSPRKLLAMIYGLNNLERAALLKDLALGPDGALVNPESRLEFVRWFVRGHMETSGDPDDLLVQEIFSQVLEQLATFAGPEELFIAMFRVLEDSLLVPNDDDPDWSAAIRRRLDERKHTMQGYEEYQKVGWNRYANEVDVHEDGDEDEDEGYTHDEGTPAERRAKALRRKLEVSRPDLDDAGYEKLLRERILGVRASTNLAHSDETEAPIIEWLDTFERRVPGYRDERTAVKLGPSDFAVAFAQQLGSLGVRALQVAGQYLTLPKSIQDRIDTVYDRVQWQSKWAADDMLVRHWPEYASVVAAFEKKIGGGAMNTVFKTEIAWEEWEALKISNPSLMFELETVTDIFEKTFTLLAGRDPRYVVALPILADLREWIEADYRSEDFLSKDADFRGKWQGFSVNKRKNPYRIEIPLSKGPESTKFRREQWIDGLNLTDAEALRNQGHDLEQIFELVAGHALRQMLDGQVHSDMHVGNFRVTADRKVAVLDRNFYLRFDDEDKATLRAILRAQSSNQSSKAFEALAARLRALPQNADLPTLDFGSADVDSLEGVMAFLRNSGYRIPLRYTLLAKNLASLESMRRRLGVQRSLAEVLAGGLDVATKARLIF